jgi:hypothetical protein
VGSASKYLDIKATSPADISTTISDYTVSNIQSEGMSPRLISLNMLSGRAAAAHTRALSKIDLPLPILLQFPCASRRSIRYSPPFLHLTWRLCATYRSFTTSAWFTPWLFLRECAHFHVLRLTRPIRNAANPAYAEQID